MPLPLLKAALGPPRKGGRLGNRLVHPAPGTLLLFPSHCHHRTWATGVDEERICVAFDVVGVE